MDATPTFLEQLIAAGHLIPMGVDGLYGKSGVFEDILNKLDALISRHGAAQQAEVMRFPPAISQQNFEESEYLKTFPHFAGTVHCFCGDEREHRRVLDCVAEGKDWTEGQKASGVVLTPAACYPSYPVIARRGPLSEEGVTLDLLSYCFRHEPSLEPTRLQLFRMREYVRMGTPDQVLAFRQHWLEEGEKMMRSLALPLIIDVANDPFFGRAGRVLAASQREQKLKFELLVPVNSEESPTACLSFNYHMDHFGLIWALRTPGDEVAHTACVGFGLERITLALFRHHGFDPKAWPTEVQAVLGGF
ncbi:amino acid--[acyl-carrier-protein] ligase [Curvibacter sp. RS43]|uniref:Amino acid--[acyl-carrier-protein] ligase n=1 Tax=Curvibacter microcysteis TaxID=3026419 RepID=A0ABT5ME77_9BURK|nr:MULTISPECIES: amino acid--[acyl-carrier-protein] ligase [unclassified Curvibacter]MDD0809711.1 amino acid--[acyl-carrier-protein] ligase [Curvibacter sp. RS43]MDD0814888.1 amino acid--[acyl-carrier-protein] ligase [Curvibacter sp. HBC28]